ncbi:MAG: porin [Proteobacteria bacterium]|nr:porin [Pseudomonadota bacterium]
MITVRSSTSKQRVPSGRWRRAVARHTRAPLLIAACAVALLPRAASAEETAAKSWYDSISYRAFVDAYYSVNYRFPKPDDNSVGMVRAFDQDNGFALSWAGLDLSTPTEPVGGTVSLRFGPTANRFALADAGLDFGLEFLKQAFVSWKPLARLTLDFGKFGTPFGAEVSEAQDNFNYTRGVLNWAGQPFFHTGLRATLTLSEQLTATLIAVNGWDRTLDNNTMKTFGLQLAYTTQPVSVVLGYMVGPEQDDAVRETDAETGAVSVREDSEANGRLRHFVDAIVTARPSEKLTFLLNGDLGAETFASSGGDDTSLWYGASLGVQYRPTATVAGALRGEYFGDPDGIRLGVADQNIVTGTLTLDYLPSPYLVLRLDNRLDWADQGIFASGTSAGKDTQFTTTLGVIVKSS